LAQAFHSCFRERTDELPYSALAMQSAFLWCLYWLLVANCASSTTALAEAAVAVGVSLAQQTVRIQPAPAGNEVSRTLLALDANGDGIVSPTEVTAFAMSQGLDAGQASQEFQTMDSNSDGTLDAAELSAALGNTATESDQTRAAALATPVLAGVAFPQQQQQLQQQQQQQQQSQLPNTYVASAPVQRSTLGTPAARAAGATAAAPAANNASPGSFLDTGLSAKKAATEVVKQLSLEAKEEAKAEASNSRAIELRTNSSTITRMASEQALEAGAQAARKVADQLLDKISKLEHQAKEDEVEAAKLRAKSHADVLHADQLMAAADSALKR